LIDGGKDDLVKLLEDAPTRPMRRRLVRCVAALDFLEGSPPTYLYTSGRPGRCNPRGVECLYFSETERVANLEYRRPYVNTSSAATEPRLMFFAKVDLTRVVDLARPAVLRAFRWSAEDVRQPWRTSASPTRLQRLGLAISEQKRVSAVRFPSDACWRAGTKGWNVAIFPGAIVAPSSLQILGRSGTSLEELP
jgi:RES domain-containing protein